MNKQQLANKIWESANKMRSKIEANDYKDYILGFVFYKFLSEKLERFLAGNEFSRADMQLYLNEENAETLAFVQESLGYFIAYEHLFSRWIEKGRDFDVSDVRDALGAFARLVSPSHKKVFDRIFETLQTGLSKLGDSAASQTKAISDLIHLIDDIPMDGRQDYDVLGFIYEYLISMFAANAGKKAGEFYTPHEVSLLMSEIIAEHLKNRDKIKIYDPTSGSGSLLINIGHSVSKYQKSKDSIRYYAQELKENTFNLTRMNLIMRDINASNIVVRNADTLEDDWPYFDDADPVGTYDPLYVDAVVSNPPYSQAWNPEHKAGDPRYAGFGLAPKTKADFAFLLHDLYHLKPDGIMAIILPHGVLFRGGEEERIRTNLLEKNHIDAVIGLPANIFFGTGIPTIILILRQNRDNSDVLFVDAAKEFIKAGKQNKLQAAHIRKIADAVNERREIPKFSRRVPLAEIRAQGYNLNIPRYIDSAEPADSFDLYALMHGGIPEHEIDLLADYWAAFPSLRGELFERVGDAPYCRLKTDIAAAITANADTRRFADQLSERFADFADSLHEQLICRKDTLHIAHSENHIGSQIFTRLAGVPLVDPYRAYQAFADQWQTIAADLEIIQSEGTAAIKAVDANMIIKKKGGKEVEEQDGYIGRILPFELVQRAHLGSELAALTAAENRLAAISSELAALLETLSEEDKQSPAISEDGTAFVGSELTKALHEALLAEYGKLTKAELNKKLAAHRFEAGSLADTLQTAAALLGEEKTLKAALKKQHAALAAATKTAIENLSDDEADELLAQKWIAPIISAMSSISDGILAQLAEKTAHLSAKYADTLSGIDAELSQAERDFARMLGELTGSSYDMQAVAAMKALLEGE